MYHLLIAVAGVVGLMALWLGVQALGRRGAGQCDGPDRAACGACAPERAGYCNMKVVETDTEQV
jgi:hypothetical protein